MTEANGPNGNGKPNGEDLEALLKSAEQLRDRANSNGLHFVAYLANMTVLEISQEIERRIGSD